MNCLSTTELPFYHILTYRKQLDKFKLGHALWRAGTKDDRGEVDIGDIGYLQNGAFKRLFSVAYPDECTEAPLAKKLPLLGDLSSPTSRFTERCIEQNVLCNPPGIATWSERTCVFNSPIQW